MTQRKTTGRGLAALAAVALAAGLVPIAAAETPSWLFRPLDGPVAQATPPLPPPAVFPVQLVLDDDAAEGSFGVADGSGARQFLWFNRFAQPPGPGFDLEEVWVLFPAAPGISVGDAVDLAIYLDPDSDPTNGAQLLATFGVTVQAADDDTFSVYPLAAPVPIRDPGDVLVGVVPRFIQSGDPPVSPAALDTTASQGRSWVALWSGVPPALPELPPDLLISRVDDLAPGFPGNWMIRGFGSEPSLLEIPALGGSGLALLALLLAAAGVMAVRHRASAETR